MDTKWKLPASDFGIRALKAPTGKRIPYYDDTHKGLVLRVTGKEGKEALKSWSFVYRMTKGGKMQRETIGQYPAVTLGQARAVAVRMQALVDTPGRHPAEALAETKDKDEDGGDGVSGEPSYTFGALLPLYLDELKHQEEPLLPLSIQDIKHRMENHLGRPHWNKRDIRTIKWKECRERLRAVKSSSGAVYETPPPGRTLGAPPLKGGEDTSIKLWVYCRGFFNWAVREEYLDGSPMGPVKKPAKAVHLTRWLKDEEIKAVWPAMQELGYPFGPIFSLGLLLGQRPGEVRKMKWSGINLEEGTWSRAKGKGATRTPSRCRHWQ
jgi:hypothetical protein